MCAVGLLPTVPRCNYKQTATSPETFPVSDERTYRRANFFLPLLAPYNPRGRRVAGLIIAIQGGFSRKREAVPATD